VALPYVFARPALVAACALSLAGCSLFAADDAPTDAARPVVTATVTASPTGSPTAPNATPTPSPTPGQQEPQPTPDDVPVAAVVSIADANSNGSLTVGGFVNGISEDGGTCTFTATHGSTTRSLQQDGLDNQGTTACGSVTFSASQLDSGLWNVRIAYSGPSGEFRSETTTVELP
jgi:hypothetical protein